MAKRITAVVSVFEYRPCTWRTVGYPHACLSTELPRPELPWSISGSALCPCCHRLVSAPGQVAPLAQSRLEVTHNNWRRSRGNSVALSSFGPGQVEPLIRWLHCDSPWDAPRFARRIV